MPVVEADRVVAEQVMGFVKSDLSAERKELVRQTLEAVLECEHLGVIDEVDRAIDVQGKRLLDVGCGHCWHGPLALARGATSFCGIDLLRDPGLMQVYDRRGHVAGLWKDEAYRPVPLSLQEFMDAFESISLRIEDVINTDLAPGSFDGAFLLTVTEHLMDTENAFRRTHELLAPGGRLFVAHHNYYCWNGHHQQPKFVDEFDPNNEAMQRFADWNHLVEFAPNDRAGEDFLNYIRIHELMDIVVGLFDVDRWEFVPTRTETGRERFTDEIRQRFPQYYTEELLTDMVRFAATKRTTTDASGGGAASLGTGVAADHLLRIDLTWSEPETGHCYISRVPAIGQLKELVLLEDGREIGPGNSMHADIRADGCGRYSVWGNLLYFAASDNTDPRSNGRQYTLVDRRLVERGSA